ncbi:MAG TPA: cupin domain-containing protein [Naasia sp.]|jgi:mannose-6-phosphate isomerase-like protein (cupin superfamily)
MHSVVKASELRSGQGRTARFEGEPYGSGVSFFLVDIDPGEGPVLHRHPYSETWVVLSGLVRVTDDDETLEAGRGDIVVVHPGTKHKFVNVGPDKLEMVCIHASPRMIQENLE